MNIDSPFSDWLEKIIKDAWELGSAYGDLSLPEAKQEFEIFLKSIDIDNFPKQ